MAKKILAGILAALLIVIAVVAVLLILKEKKSGGTERGREQKERVEKVGQDKQTGSKGEDDAGRKGTGEPLSTAGKIWAARKGWSYLWTESGLHVFRDGEAEAAVSIAGAMSNRLVAVDAGVYFGQGSDLVFCENTSGKTTVIYRGQNAVQPLGLTSRYLYFAEADAADGDSLVIFRMDRKDGAVKSFEYSDFCMHSDVAFCGDRIFYTSGVADVSTSSVKEIDQESGEVFVIEDNSSSALLADGRTLYYIRTGEEGDYTRLDAELVRRDAVSGKEETLRSSKGREMGTIFGVEGDVLYLSGSSGILTLENGKEKLLVAGKGRGICVREGQVYYVADGSLYRCSRNGEQGGRLLELDSGEYVVGVFGGYATYWSGGNYKRIKVD